MHPPFLSALLFLFLLFSLYMLMYTVVPLLISSFLQLSLFLFFPSLPNLSLLSLSLTHYPPPPPPPPPLSLSHSLPFSLSRCLFPFLIIYLQVSFISPCFLPPSSLPKLHHYEHTQSSLTCGSDVHKAAYKQSSSSPSRSHTPRHS